MNKRSFFAKLGTALTALCWWKPKSPVGWKINPAFETAEYEQEVPDYHRWDIPEIRYVAKLDADGKGVHFVRVDKLSKETNV